MIAADADHQVAAAVYAQRNVRALAGAAGILQTHGLGASAVLPV